MLNGSTLNGAALNGSSQAEPSATEVTLYAGAEDSRQEVFAMRESLSAGADISPSWTWAQAPYLLAEGFSPVETFYNPSVETTEEVEAALQVIPAIVEALQLAAEGDVSTEDSLAAVHWLRGRAEASLETGVQRYAEPLLEALSELTTRGATAELIQLLAESEDSTQYLLGVELLDAVAAALSQEAVLVVSATETLKADAGDSVEALGRYLANVNDLAGAWVTFKVSGEIVQGWVMNVEGERPLSEYRGFDFNSFARIGSRYFAANDSGLYTLGADTDDGEPIDAHVRSMMLDFGTSAQKRVVAAYLGYTAQGTLVLKVRSEDDGKLVEHWYEAQEVTADAPRTNYKPLGRGLRSRYWQFELANVDGADFEVDKLELYPLRLNRRV